MTPPGKAGRPAKADLSEAEFQTLIPILALKRGQHGGSLQVAANEISRGRGALEAVDPRTRAARSVSARWIQLALARRGIAGKKGMREKYPPASVQGHSGKNSEALCDTASPLSKPEMPTTEQPAKPFRIEKEILNGPPTEGAAPFAPEVESEQGAKA